MYPQGQQPEQQPQQQPQPTNGGVPPVWQQPAQQPMQGYDQQQTFTPNTPGANTANYSVDYLNQIAPQEQKKVNRFAVIALIAGVLISALFGVVLLSSSSGPSVNDQLVPIASRIATLETITETQQPHLRETKISEANAALNSSLTSMNSSITAILKERKLKINAKSTQGKKETTYSTALAKTLDDSYQRGTLDATYTSQMTYELTVLKSKLSKLKRSTKSTSLTTFANDGIANINTILAAYDSFESADTTDDTK
jgi:hypothetical protein